jgi:hypothetical protein
MNGAIGAHFMRIAVFRGIPRSSRAWAVTNPPLAARPDETGTIDPAPFYRDSPMKGLDDVTGEEPSTCKATSQPEFSPAASRKPSIRLEWRRGLCHIGIFPIFPTPCPPVLAIGGNRLHKSF